MAAAAGCDQPLPLSSVQLCCSLEDVPFYELFDYSAKHLSTTSPEDATYIGHATLTWHVRACPKEVSSPGVQVLQTRCPCFGSFRVAVTFQKFGTLLELPRTAPGASAGFDPLNFIVLYIYADCPG
jgi:hypothetical protein